MMAPRLSLKSHVRISNRPSTHGKLARCDCCRRATRQARGFSMVDAVFEWPRPSTPVRCWLSLQYNSSFHFPPKRNGECMLYCNSEGMVFVKGFLVFSSSLQMWSIVILLLCNCKLPFATEFFLSSTKLVKRGRMRSSNFNLFRNHHA